MAITIIKLQRSLLADVNFEVLISSLQLLSFFKIYSIIY